ncbi:MAG TPA: rRNA maturation RNase YbeY [Candidatus Acidoferrales bacterium]|nr:rRNA maturation RNase YbeY [Candidatus Acidoferrales bacterium]
MVINRQKRVPVKIRSLDAFCRRAASALRLSANAATVCLVSDAQIATWNRLYRGKPKPTDVLSFPVGAQNGHRNGSRIAWRAFNSSLSRETHYLGDIAIAPAVARRNARALGRSFDYELRILALHGLLHLMGYDHETDNGTMDRLESRLRRKLRLA